MHNRSVVLIKKGFTLIELLTVISIIGIIAAIALPNYHRSLIKAEAAKIAENLNTLRLGITTKFPNGNYPNEWYPPPPPFPSPEVIAGMTLEQYNQWLKDNRIDWKGKAPPDLADVIPDSVFQGARGIQMQLANGFPSVWRWQQRWGLQEKEPYLVVTISSAEGNKVMYALQQMLGVDKFHWTSANTLRLRFMN